MVGLVSKRCVCLRYLVGNHYQKLPLPSPNQINRNIKVKEQYLVDYIKASWVLIELKPAQVVFDKWLDGRVMQYVLASLLTPSRHWVCPSYTTRQ